jgi:hypothetical protein
MTVLDRIVVELETRQQLVSGSYIRFIRHPELETGVTQRWEVSSSGGDNLGQVKWFGNWRKYCFSPFADTVYEEVCLREIAFFGEQLTKLHREAKKAKGVSA